MSDQETTSPGSHEIVAYRTCFEEKRHYDILSWTIGAIILAAVGFLNTAIPKIVESSSVNLPLIGCVCVTFFIKRLIVFFFIVILLGFWLILYNRNRIWAEAANERARDFERKWKLEGVALKYMKVGRPLKDKPSRPKVDFKNRDENDDDWGKPATAKGTRIAMHTVVNCLFWAGIFLSLLSCVFL